jgi:transcriptional regulator GlxA family with amidase domain
VVKSRFRGREKSVSPSPSSNGHRARTQDRRVQLVLMLLEENSQRQLALGDIAKLVNLSPGRLAHLFKSEIGHSIQQYLTQIRLARAKHQLESSFLSIKEIAASAGFANVNRFTASFKTAVGTTPAQYRRLPGITHAKRKDLAIARSANR